MKILETHIVPAIEQKIRLQEYAFSIFVNISTRSALKKAIKKNQILIDSRIATSADWIEPGQKIELIQTEIPSRKVFKYDLEVLFQDDFIAIVKKPAGFPTNGNYFRTVENALPHNLKPSSAPDLLQYPEPVHRLDSPTSGILLIAKTRNARARLHKEFSQKNIEKIYYAIVHEFVEAKREINIDIEDKNARTLIIPQDHFSIKSEKYTLVKAIPLTGRTHQIRIHLSHIGHAIVGDHLYGERNDEFFRNKNLYLFAGGILFKHPITTESLNFEISLPKKFRNLSQYSVH